MLPKLGLGTRLRYCRTRIDAKLMDRTGFDEVTLCRVRKALVEQYTDLTWGEQRTLLDGNTIARFRFLNCVLTSVLPKDLWWAWLRYLEHSEVDLGEMAGGEYPISPYIIRVYSALFGIKIDFLLVGQPPVVDPEGANIEVLNATGTAP